MNVFLRQADEFFGRFSRFGGTMPLLIKLLGNDDLMKWWIAALIAELNTNPFEQTVDEQIAALRAQNVLGSWGIAEEIFDRLAETAPAWPKGKDAYRSLRIRFGEGRDGVIKTFEAHMAAIERVHAKFWRWELLLSGEHPYRGKPVDRLRLLNGNDSHKAVVEWVVVSDLSANRQRKDITSVRGSQSLADEGLVLAWLFPKRVQAIDYNTWCAWFCAGYESNVPEGGGGGWRLVVCVSRSPDSGKVDLYADLRGSGDPGCSVPPLG